MNLKKKFASDVLFSVVSNGLLSLFGLITVPILTRTLTSDLYGVWVQIGVTTGLLLAFITFGFQMTVVRFLTSECDKQRASSLFHLMFGIVLLNGLIFVLITFFFQNIISNFIFADVSFHRFVPLTGLWLMAQAIYAMNISFIRSKNKIKLLSVFNIVHSILHILVIYFVLIAFARDLQTMLVIYIIVTLLLSIIMYLSEVVRTIGISVNFYDSKSTLKDLFKFSLPFILNLPLGWILTSCDRYFIVHLLGLSENAVYSVTYSLVGILSLFYMPLGFVMYPLLVELWENDRINIVKCLLETSTKLYIYFIIPSILGLYALGSKAILMLTTSDYIVHPALILWISLGMLFYGFEQINVYIIHLIKKTYYTTILVTIAAIINIILNYFLIMAIGIEGAAISTLISYLFLAISVVLLARKTLNYMIDIKFTFKCIFSSLIMFIAVQQIAITSLNIFLLAVILGATVYLISTILLRCFTQDDMRNLKKLLYADKVDRGHI